MAMRMFNKLLSHSRPAVLAILLATLIAPVALADEPAEAPAVGAPADSQVTAEAETSAAPGTAEAEAPQGESPVSEAATDQPGAGTGATQSTEADASHAGADAATEEATATEEVAPAAEEEKDVYLKQVFGWGMLPLWICSVVLLALALERRAALKPSRIIDAEMMEEVADKVSRLEIEPARQTASQSPTVVGQAWAQGFHEFLLGGMSLSEALTNSTALAMKPLKRNLQAISTLGNISPLFGLLGTIVGMIIIFSQIAATGGADKGELAGGIGLALFTTAGGLIVAIPAILISRYFMARLTGLAEQAEAAINRINYRYSHAVAQQQQDSADNAATRADRGSHPASGGVATAGQHPVAAAVAAASAADKRKEERK